MNRCIIAVAGLGVALTASNIAQAQVMLDLSKVTCDQFIKYKVADPKLIAVWLNGYFHGKRADTKVDTQKLNADADEVEKFCFKNSSSVDAVRRVHRRKRQLARTELLSWPGFEGEAPPSDKTSSGQQP
jgi:acid stress chaperone HdeB